MVPEVPTLYETTCYWRKNERGLAHHPRSAPPDRYEVSEFSSQFQLPATPFSGSALFRTYFDRPAVKHWKSSVSGSSGICPVKTRPAAIIVAAWVQISTVLGCSGSLSRVLTMRSSAFLTRSCSSTIVSPFAPGTWTDTDSWSRFSNNGVNILRSGGIGCSQLARPKNSLCLSISDLSSNTHIIAPQQCLNIPNAPIYSDLAFRGTIPKQPIRRRLQCLQTPIERTGIDSLNRRIDVAQILG
jgi:hypothetical protein